MLIRVEENARFLLRKSVVLPAIRSCIQQALNLVAQKQKTTSKTSLTISGLKKNKTYYVKVRAYKKDSQGKKVYGSYSAVKKVKIKK